MFRCIHADLSRGGIKNISLRFWGSLLLSFWDSLLLSFWDSLPNPITEQFLDKIVSNSKKSEGAVALLRDAIKESTTFSVICSKLYLNEGLDEDEWAFLNDDGISTKTQKSIKMFRDEVFNHKIWCTEDFDTPQSMEEDQYTLNVVEDRISHFIKSPKSFGLDACKKTCDVEDTIVKLIQTSLKLFNVRVYTDKVMAGPDHSDNPKFNCIQK